MERTLFFDKRDLTIKENYGIFYWCITRCSAGGSAPVSGTGGREFESRHFDQTLLIRTFEIQTEL